MTFHLRVLKKAFEIEPCKPFDQMDEGKVFSQLIFVDQSIRKFDPSNLYIGKASQLPDVFLGEQPVYFLCIADTVIPPVYGENSNAVLMLLPGDTSEYVVYNKIIAAVEAEYTAVLTSQKLFENLTKAKTADAMIQEAFKVLENPIIYTDMGLNVIAYSKDGEIENTPLNDMVKNSRPSLEELKSIRIGQIYHRLRETKEPFFYTNDSFPQHTQIFAPVLINNTPVAAVSVHELFRPFMEYDMDRVKMLSSFLALERERNDFDQYAKGFPYEYILKDILDGKTGSLSVLESKLKTMGYRPKKFFYVMTVRSCGSNAADYSFDFFRNNIEQLTGNGISVVYENQVIVILNDDRELQNRDFEALVSFAEQYGLCGGVSRSFRFLKDMKQNYLESCMAATIAMSVDKAEPIFFFEDSIPYQLIRFADQQKEDVSRYIHPALNRLLDYDAAHKTNFTNTLYVYLINERNLAATVKQVYLHRNTVLYRIEKIETILGKSLDDAAFRFGLLLSFYILDYENRQAEYLL